MGDVNDGSKRRDRVRTGKENRIRLERMQGRVRHTDTIRMVARPTNDTIEIPATNPGLPWGPGVGAAMAVRKTRVERHFPYGKHRTGSSDH